MSASEQRIGPYRLLGELGRGGMGVVYTAVDEQLGRRVALKLLLGAQPVRAARFAREVELAASFEHPHVVRIHAAGVHQGRPYYAMELVEGESLARRLTRGPLAEGEARRHFADLADALAALHAAGIVHRDIKPDNVLLGADGRARLTDFGLARSLADERERLTRTGQLVGSPLSLSPEQAQGDKHAVGPPTDVWALAVTLYQALTGEPPFRGAGLIQVLAAIAQCQPRPPRALRRELSPQVEALVLGCLRLSPEARPSARELAEGLRAEAAPRAARGGWALGAAALLCGGLALGLLLPELAADPRAADSPSALASSPTPATSATPQAQPAPRWERVAGPQPPWRTGGGVCVDPSGRVYLWGGAERSTSDHQLWSYQPGAGWRGLTPEGEPPRRRHSPAMVYDPRARSTLVHGGKSPGLKSGFFSDLWEVDERGWRRARQVGAKPGPRAFHGAAYHPGWRRVVFYGGFTRLPRSRTLADLWRRDEGGWHEVTGLGPGPGPRSSPTLCSWPAREGVALFGGVQPGRGRGVLRDDLWLLDQRGWTELSAPGPRPSPRRRPLLGDDGAGGLLLCGGVGEESQQLADLWRWSEGRWRELEVDAELAPRHLGGVSLGPGRLLVLRGDAAGPQLESWLLELR